MPLNKPYDERKAPLRKIVWRAHQYGMYVEEFECGHYYNGAPDHGYRGRRLIKARRCTVCAKQAQEASHAG